jgi:TonB family protein
MMRPTICASRFAILLVLVLPAYAQTQTSEDTEKSKQSPSTSSGVFRVGGSVSPPRVTYGPDPEYSDEARKAKYQGVCVLWMIVGADGSPRDVRVARRLGRGLDEKAIEAVRKWRFEPALKDSKPVAVMINVEVSFRLYDERSKKIQELWRRSNEGDAKAELELSKVYLNGVDVTTDEKRGTELLAKAADRGLPEAQFLMGEHIVANGGSSPDYVTAYMWCALAKRGGYKHSEKILKQLSPKMSPDQLSEAQRRVDSWLETHPH